MSAKDFIILSELGKGSYSSVYKVRRISDEKEYALKKVRLLSLKDKQKSNALNQVRILASITSEYIISYKEAFLQEANNCLCIIMEFADGGDLQQKIDKTIKKRGYFPESEVWKISKDILSGLKVLHDMKIVHRDIKTANIFISDGLYKLGDLNVSKILERGLAYTQTGTPYYASPQVWRDQPYDNKSDIWSLGCLIYQVCSLRPPFQAKDMSGLYKKVQTGKFDRIPSRYSQELQKFIEACLQLNPISRPSCESLLKNPMLHGTINQQIGSQNNLLDTIQIPRNLQRLKGLLPKSKYEQTESTDRMSSRRSESTTVNKQKVMPIMRKNGSERNMLPQLIVPKHMDIKISNGDYEQYHKKRQEGSYKLQSEQKQTQSNYAEQMKARILKVQQINDEYESKLRMRQRSLLEGVASRGSSNQDRYKELSVKLPAIQHPAIRSLKVNSRPGYEYSKPSWWG